MKSKDKESDKRLYLVLNQKMLSIQDEMDILRKTPGTEEKLKQKEKLYRKTLEQANATWDGCEAQSLFENKT